MSQPVRAGVCQPKPPVEIALKPIKAWRTAAIKHAFVRKTTDEIQLSLKKSKKKEK